MDKLKILNEIEVIETSSCNGELDYILIKNNEENVSILKELGMTEEDEGYMIDDDLTTIEIACFAFNKLGAVQWDCINGFSDVAKGL